MTLNDVERRHSLYVDCFFSPNSIDFQADYIAVVEYTYNVRNILYPSSSLPL